MPALRFVVVTLVAALFAAFSLPACSVVNAPEEAVEPSSSSTGGNGTGGDGSGGDSCDMTAPTVTSSNMLGITSDMAQYTLTFSEEVTLEDGAITVDGGAMVSVTPALPSSGTSFTVDLTGLVPGMASAITVSAMGVVDDCGNSLANDFTVTLTNDCEMDTDPPTLVATDTTFPDGAMSGTFVLEFSEPTNLAMGAITATGAATVDSVMPALPATATTFSVTVGNLVDSTRLVVLPGSIQDVCGNSPAMAQELLLCNEAGGSITFGTPGNVNFTVPACAKGTVNIVARGAEGGTVSANATGGLGGMASGDLAVTTGDTLQVRVGGQGAGMAGQNCNEVGGSNGGGNTGFTCCGAAGTGAGSGGGASDVRYMGTALNDRVIVAGGGGGGGSNNDGGDGGGLTGMDGMGTYNGAFAVGGSQTAGGTPGGHFTGDVCSVGTAGTIGQGGVGDGNDGGGGGGGYFGGGGGANNGGGAGGSSYIGGVTNGMTMPGINTGNGSVTISWI